ncbi:MAG: hypothetical protein RL500_1927, partial [Pseudomonadota bacterium]
MRTQTEESFHLLDKGLHARCLIVFGLSIVTSAHGIRLFI